MVKRSKMLLGFKRMEMLNDGAYDGRYRQRVVLDKKKKANRNWARKSK